jgi:hypothetical protein
MVRCGKCGIANPLGRVVCGACGAKLDLSQLTSDRFDRARERSDRLRRMRLLIPITVVWAVGCVLLGLWPREERIGKPGTLVGARRVEKHVATLGGIKPGQTLAVWLTEEDVNGYFEFVGAKRLNVESFSVTFEPNRVTARLVRQPTTLSVGIVEFTPRFSLEITGEPAGGRLAVRRASWGHLPLIGPLRGIASARVATAFHDWEERALLTSLENLRVETGKAELTAKK